MKFKNLKRHIEIFANTQAIPKRAITEVKEDEGMDEAKKNFVDGVQELDESDNIKLDKYLRTRCFDLEQRVFYLNLACLIVHFKVYSCSCK